MFRNLCDESDELICITDTSNKYMFLYISKKFNELLGSNLLDTSLLEIVNDDYKDTLISILKNNKLNNTQNCARIKCTYNTKKYVMLIRPRKVDNIILYSIKNIIIDEINYLK